MKINIAKLTPEDRLLMNRHPSNIFDWRQKLRRNRIKQACREFALARLRELREQRTDIERREHELIAALERDAIR